MARLIRMDHTGHTTLAEWTAGDAATAATGNESGSSASISTATPMNGIVCASVLNVQPRSRRRRRAASSRGRQ